MARPETNENLDTGVGAEGRRFSYKPQHLISILRQVAADNPFQYETPAEQANAWELIATQLEKVGITAQWRSSQIKCLKLLDDYEKELRQPLKSGTEPELCTELNQLLQDVSTKQKEEVERHTEIAKAKKESKGTKKSREKTATDFQAGKEIREASLITMKRNSGKHVLLPRSTSAFFWFMLLYSAHLSRVQ